MHLVTPVPNFDHELRIKSNPPSPSPPICSPAV